MTEVEIPEDLSHAGVAEILERLLDVHAQDLAQYQPSTAFSLGCEVGGLVGKFWRSKRDRRGAMLAVRVSKVNSDRAWWLAWAMGARSVARTAVDERSDDFDVRW